ncbi:hypothetical protein ACRRTK_014691 [Alexandromys fortis]
MAVMEEVCHCGGRLVSHMLKVRPMWYTIHILLPANQDVELSTPPASCLPTCPHVPPH